MKIVLYVVQELRQTGWVSVSEEHTRPSEAKYDLAWIQEIGELDDEHIKITKITTEISEEGVSIVKEDYH
jgi:hypothetical protein